MSQEPEDEVEISIDGAIFTTEAELRAWYIATNPMLRSVGISCPAKLYREMQRDLRDFDATVAIVPVPEDMCSLRLLTVMANAACFVSFIKIKLLCLIFLHGIRRANVDISPFCTVHQHDLMRWIPAIESDKNLGVRMVGNPRRAARKVHDRVRSRVVDYPLGVCDVQNVATVPRDAIRKVRMVTLQSH